MLRFYGVFGRRGCEVILFWGLFEEAMIYNVSIVSVSRWGVSKSPDQNQKK